MASPDKDNGRITRKSALLLVAFLCAFIGGIVAFHTVPAGITRKYDQFTTTSDGLRVAYDVFEPTVPGGGEGNGSGLPAVIVGHGIMVNKEVMRVVSLELARAGFLVIALDFRGHGSSSGDFSSVANTLDLASIVGGGDADVTNVASFGALARDVEAVKENYLAKRGDVDMGNLGYVGYSMGGGAGFATLAEDGNFSAMVGIAPVPSYEEVNASRPRNLLVVVGKFDQAIPYGDVLKVMENKTGVSREEIADAVERDSAWEFPGGSFPNGTAARLYRDPLGEHFLAGWNQNFVRETRDWMVRALLGGDSAHGGATGPSPVLQAYPVALVTVAAAAGGGVGAFALAARWILSKYGKRADDTIFPESVLDGDVPFTHVKGVTVTALLLAFPCMLLVTPLFLGPLFFAAFNVMFLFGPSIGILVYMRHAGKKHGFGARDLYASTLRATSGRNVAVGLGLGGLLWAVLELTVGQLFSLLPSADKWPWLPLYYAVVTFTFLNYYLFYQGLVQEGLTRGRDAAGAKRGTRLTAALNYAMVAATAVFVLLFPCLVLGNMFVWMFIWVALLMLLGATVIGVTFYARTGDALLPALTTAVFITLMFCTLSPVIWITGIL
ncbi:MAG: alpha/beta hydrolase [Promethearchaeota archaeon]